MSKHTPGPWMTDHNVVYTTNRDDGNRFMAHVQAGHLDDDSRTTHEEVKANVNLIAAAPDMLEALDRLTKWAEVMAEAQTCEHTGDHPIAVARKALIKALTGESQ